MERVKTGEMEMKTAPTLIFEGGELSILTRGFGEKDGSGELIVKETDLEFDGEGYCTLPIARTELIAIRDHISKHLEGGFDEK